MDLVKSGTWCTRTTVVDNLHRRAARRPRSSARCCVRSERATND